MSNRDSGVVHIGSITLTPPRKLQPKTELRRVKADRDNLYDFVCELGLERQYLDWLKRTEDIGPATGAAGHD